MSLRKPRTVGQWLLLIIPTFIILASAALGFIAERAVPRGGFTALLAFAIGLVPALILCIAQGCWLLGLQTNDDYGRAVKGGLLGLGLLAANFLLSLPGLIVLGNLMR
ncbi:MAG: hypothetical protein EOP84_28075 [Verrucomicrobiaceae bacterium]|nr:MAG: hypothetical protein EOP84_28075 [Verrucomicrobiaceae bacterium]